MSPIEPCPFSSAVDPGTEERAPGRRGPRAGAAVLFLLLALLLGGCDLGLLGVDDPDLVEPDDLTSPTGLEARRMGAIGDFAVAYSGPGGSGLATSHVPTTGLLADEFQHTGPAPWKTKLDMRRAGPSNRQIERFHRTLHRARRAAESAARVFREAAEAERRERTLAEMNALAGYSYVFFGEAFCSGVPFSRITPEGRREFGEPRTTTEILRTAVDRFDRAREAASRAGRDRLVNLARVGKARALLDLDEAAGAADVASGVPTGFEFLVRHSADTERQRNEIARVGGGGRFSVANREGTNGVAYRSAFEAGDPRTPWKATEIAENAGGVKQFGQLKYRFLDSDVPLATGVEARLIEAEAALRNGELARFESLHNGLRARLDADAVGPIEADTLSAEQRVTFHFRERALWLWLTGHRLGDLRRLVRQYGRSVEAVYPTGAYFRPNFGSYGSQAVLPVPASERNNPEFSGCLELAP